MKIALLYPDVADCFPPYPPVNLAYLASQLERIGEEVLILDLKVQPDWRKRLFSFNPDFVGITVVAFAFKRGLEIVDLIKQNLGAKVMLGGPQVTIFQEELFQYTDVDYLFFGEAEHSIREFFINYKDGKSLSQVKGLIYRANGRMIKNAARDFEDNLDSLPYPAWHLINLNLYDSVPVVTSRGCPYGCVFCAVDKLEGRRFRTRSAENVVSEVEYLHREFGTKSFLLSGDNFLIDRQRVLDICRLIMEKGLDIYWSISGARADLLDPELLENMKQAGCQSLSFGIESGSERILKLINKGITTAQIEQAVKMVKEAGLSSCGSFMIGNPDETKETVNETINFARRLFSGGLVARWSNFNLAVPYPGTMLWEWVKKNGSFLIEDPLDFPAHIQYKNIQPAFETPQFRRAERVKMAKKAWRLWFKVCARQKRNQLWQKFKEKNNWTRVKRWISRMNEENVKHLGPTLFNYRSFIKEIYLLYKKFDLYGLKVRNSKGIYIKSKRLKRTASFIAPGECRQNKGVISYLAYLWNKLSLSSSIRDIRPRSITGLFHINNEVEKMSLQDKETIPIFYITDKNAQYLFFLKRLLLQLKIKKAKFIYYNTTEASPKFDFLKSNHIVEPVYKFMRSLQEKGVALILHPNNITTLFKDLQADRPILNHQSKSVNRQLNIREFNQRRIVLESYPLNIYVELTRNCNCHCRMCARNQQEYNPKLNMSFNLFKQVADTLFPYADYVSLNGFGESTILTDFQRYVDYALNFDAQFYLITNLSLKDDALWPRLIKNGLQIGVSFDGATKKTFEFIRRGANFDTVVDNLKLLVKSAARFSRPIKHIYLIVCVQGHNLVELPKIIWLANSLGIKKMMFSPVILEEGNPNNLALHQKLVYRQIKQSLELANTCGIEVIFSSSLGNKNLDEELGLQSFKRCVHPWSFAQIAYDGEVSLCNNLGSHPIVFGNLQQNDFSQIWNSYSYQLFRKSIKTEFMYKWCDWCHKNRFNFW